LPLGSVEPGCLAILGVNRELYRLVKIIRLRQIFNSIRGNFRQVSKEYRRDRGFDPAWEKEQTLPIVEIDAFRAARTDPVERTNLRRISRRFPFRRWRTNDSTPPDCGFAFCEMSPTRPLDRRRGLRHRQISHALIWRALSRPASGAERRTQTFQRISAPIVRPSGSARPFAGRVSPLPSRPRRE
jgi:hypothetical protein